MSKCHPMLVLIVGGLLGGVLVSSLNSPTALAGGVVSPRKAKSVRSYFATGKDNEVVEVIASTGDDAFIITDILFSGGGNAQSMGRLQLIVDGETVVSVTYAGSTSVTGGPFSYHLESGIPVGPKRALSALLTAPVGTYEVTVCGYIH